MGNSIAFWNISLDTDCPNCGEGFDLTDTIGDFWDGSFGAMEHNTERTKNVDVKCLSCGHKFLVDFDY